MIKLHNDEIKQYSFHRHPIVLLLPIVIAIVLFVLPPILYTWLPFGSPFEITGGAAELLTFFYLCWALILWLAFSVTFIDYWLDVWIVTDKRLLDFEQQGLFRREVAVTDLSDIEDVTIKVKGILPSMLDFGDIIVQTAGTRREFMMRDIIKPDKVKRIINELADK
ncbi:MAG: PH domain-containing protein [bacterium]|nr:PH domain-containing protein [bacterium]